MDISTRVGDDGDDPAIKKRKITDVSNEGKKTALPSNVTSEKFEPTTISPPEICESGPAEAKTAEAIPSVTLSPFSAAWRSEVDHSCNRLISQYGDLLRSASQSSSGIMGNEPSAALSAATTLSSLRTKLSAQNIAVACARVLDLIRTLRLSALTMGTKETLEEHNVVVQEMMKKIYRDNGLALQLEGKFVHLRGQCTK
mmetsp:Transcript_3732/g.6928  ORF Transcript_3732/g.6928 Transcript_3732/m.6928 type:complete len:199 (-) Transcript_3732:785-1381(-)